MSGVPVSVCRSCTWRGFPERIWCPVCGADAIDTVTEESGVVEDATAVRRMAGRSSTRSTRIGTVRSDGGARIIARLEVEAGDRVRLTVEDGAPVARRDEGGR